MRKGEEMNILLLACAGGVLAVLVAVAADLRKRRQLQERLDRHLKWHEMEAATRKKSAESIKEQPTKKPAAKKAAPKKGGKKA
jgi:sensor domain CHASE-containing protein